MIPGKDFYNSPTTTWVIRTKDEQKWIGKVLRKLFMQSRLDFEVIIIDSGSNDKTLEIAEKYPIRKVIKIRQEEYNPSYALNLGIKEAWGKYIGIISAHSLPTTYTWYEDGMKNFQDPNVVGVSGHYSSLPDGSYDEKLNDLYFDTRRLEKWEYTKWFSNTNSILLKEAWEQYHFDEELEGCEDYDWGQEMLARGKNIVKDPKFNVFHSHGGLGRSKSGLGTVTNPQRKARWKRLFSLIDERVRPYSSYSKVE